MLKKIILLALLLLPISVIAQPTLPSGWEWARFIGQKSGVLVYNDSSWAATGVIVLNPADITIGTIELATFTTGGSFDTTLTTSAIQLGSHAADEIWFWNNTTSTTFEYAYAASPGAWMPLKPGKVLPQRFSNTNKFYFRTTGGTGTLIVEFKKY